MNKIEFMRRAEARFIEWWRKSLGRTESPLELARTAFLIGFTYGADEMLNEYAEITRRILNDRTPLPKETTDGNPGPAAPAP
jgi:hypothetical protein